MLSAVSSVHLPQNYFHLHYNINFTKKIRQFITPLIEAGDFLPVRLKYKFTFLEKVYEIFIKHFDKL